MQDEIVDLASTTDQHGGAKTTDGGALMAFEEFPKIARLSRECTITEKIDGTNGIIAIGEDGEFQVGSRTRWITPEDDNFGFARWAMAHKDELMALGPGRHFGEWWGQGIQRGYSLTEKRFSLFNTFRWNSPEKYPECCYVVPIIYQGLFTQSAWSEALNGLKSSGSRASPGFTNPEGVIVYHHAAKQYFKKTLHKDDEWKGTAAIIVLKVRTDSATGKAE